MLSAVSRGRINRLFANSRHGLFRPRQSSAWMENLYLGRVWDRRLTPNVGGYVLSPLPGLKVTVYAEYVSKDNHTLLIGDLFPSLSASRIMT